MTLRERLAARILGLDVADCVVCGRPFVQVRRAKACPGCRLLPDWTSGNFRKKQRRPIEAAERRRLRAQEQRRQDAPVLELRRQGLGYKRIARELGMTRDAVRYIVLRYERPGAPLITGPAKDAPDPASIAISPRRFQSGDA